VLACLIERLVVRVSAAIWTFAESSHHWLSEPVVLALPITARSPVIYMHMLDADELLSASTQASENFHLHRISFH